MFMGVLLECTYMRHVLLGAAGGQKRVSDSGTGLTDSCFHHVGTEN